MTQYTYIVQVYPVELGAPNLHKVKFEQEFTTQFGAETFARNFNVEEEMFEGTDRAVYIGKVDVETGELTA